MSTKFNFVLAGPMLANAQVIRSIWQCLEPMGFSHAMTVSHETMVGIKKNEQLDYEEISFADFLDGHGESWNVSVTEFLNSRFELVTAVFVQRNETFINARVQVTDKIVWEDYHDHEFRFYLAALLEIAKAINAQCGVGGLSFGCDVVSPNEILQIIRNDPNNSDYPADMGLVAKNVMDEPALKMTFGPTFRIVEKPNFWLLIGQSFDDLIKRK